ncbi:uncharacterized protein LOC110459709 isoform X1 [Mizuhopecten yessoensis]|uniref:uncharacterized protein LOC110459709 isoform X1 n=1 Tax=Mizuhopecten yessoensis TaxID=6573 RepID=UPI000B45D7BC|nr:uncharacterized protein LOC110459709 isoform X1 [Mizuhopecten yessoensis]
MSTPVYVRATPTPEKPKRVQVTSSMYGLIVTWTAPNRNPDNVIGYKVNFRYKNSTKTDGTITSNSSDSMVTNGKYWHSAILNKDTFIYVVNTRHRPGVKFDIWMESLGEVVDSFSTEVVTARANCGGSIEFVNKTQYISSGKYPNLDDDDIYCFYHVISNGEMITLTFVDLTFQANGLTMPCSSGYLRVDGVDNTCESHSSGALTSFYGHDLNLEYQSIPGRSRFLLVLTLSKQAEKVDLSDISCSFMIIPHTIIMIICVYINILLS